MKRIFPMLAAVLVLAHPASELAAAPPDARTERVEFAMGATSKVVKGRIEGYQYVDYQVRAGAGQTLAVSMKGSNRAGYFNVNPPGSEASMFIGSTSGTTFKGMLPADGDYTVRVYLMRAAARRNESSDYMLTVGVTGKPLAAVRASVDALVPGTSYHASASVGCAIDLRPEVRECEAGVIRRGFDGTATLEIRLPDGLMRRILFVKGRAVATDAPVPLSFTRTDRYFVVSLGSQERYEIPEAFVFGG